MDQISNTISSGLSDPVRDRGWVFLPTADGSRVEPVSCLSEPEVSPESTRGWTSGQEGSVSQEGGPVPPSVCKVWVPLQSKVWKDSGSSDSPTVTVVHST